MKVKTLSKNEADSFKRRIEYIRNMMKNIQIDIYGNMQLTSNILNDLDYIQEGINKLKSTIEHELNEDDTGLEDSQ